MINNRYFREVQLKRDAVLSIAYPNSLNYNQSSKGIKQLDYFAPEQ